MTQSTGLEFKTIEVGPRCHYLYGDGNFAGGLMIIRDLETWQWFWQQHTEGNEPATPLPEINFDNEMVIAALLGFQGTDGAAIKVTDVVLSEDGKVLQLRISKEDSGGMGADVITNPFHIISLNKSDFLSVVVEYIKQ